MSWSTAQAHVLLLLHVCVTDNRVTEVKPREEADAFVFLPRRLDLPINARSGRPSHLADGVYERQEQGLGRDHTGVSVERPGPVTWRRRRGLHPPEGGVHTTVPGLHLRDGCYQQLAPLPSDTFETGDKH